MLTTLLRWVLAVLGLVMGVLLAVTTLVFGISLIVNDATGSGSWLLLALMGTLSAWLILCSRRDLVRQDQRIVALARGRGPGVALALLVGVVVGGTLVASLDESDARARGHDGPKGEDPALQLPTVIRHSPLVPALVAAGSVTNADGPAPAPAAGLQLAPSPPAGILDPRSLVASLRSRGFADGLGERGWHRSRFDDMWCAVALRSHGPNEVSCLLESDASDRIGLVELEAEFHDPGHDVTALLDDLAAAVEATYPHVTPALLEAIATQRDWDGRDACLRKEPHPSGRGYDLRFTWRP